MDAPPLRELHLFVGKTRSTFRSAPTFYVPEDVFVDQEKNAVVQDRDGGYIVPMPAPESAYYEQRRKRRNSCDSDDDDADYISLDNGNPYDTIHSLKPSHYQPVNHVVLYETLPAPKRGATRQPKSRKRKEQPAELLGYAKLRRDICSWLIAPLWCCWPRDRVGREAAAFFVYYVIFNLGFFLAIVVAPPTPAPWVVAVLAIPTIMAVVRFAAAVLARVSGVEVQYTDQVRGHVLMMVPCYTEGRAGLTATLDSMAASDLRGLRGTIVAVCDGRVIGVGSTESCEEALTDMMTLDKTTVYSDYTEYIGSYKGTPMHVVAKHQNAGKRDSQIRIFRLINEGRFGNVDYIFMTDADCYFPKDSVYELCWRLSIERDTYAACGDIRVADPQNLLSKGQTYEYFLSQFHSRVAESYFATVTCLPGAFVCITTDVLTDELIRLYSAEPDSLHTAQLLKLGEDRYMTSIFMKLFPRRRAVFLPQAVLHTGVPETSTILKSQRRRWCMSAFHNMFDNLFLPKLFMWTRFTLAYDLITTWLQVSFFMLIFYSIVRVILYGDLLDYISIAAGTGFMLMTMFTACIYRRWEVIKYVGHFMLLTPMLYLVIPLSNAWNAGNVKWGKTRQVSSVASSIGQQEAAEHPGDGDDDGDDEKRNLGIGRVVDDNDDDDDPDAHRRSNSVREGSRSRSRGRTGSGGTTGNNRNNRSGGRPTGSDSGNSSQGMVGTLDSQPRTYAEVYIPPSDGMYESLRRTTMDPDTPSYAPNVHRSNPLFNGGASDADPMALQERYIEQAGPASAHDALLPSDADAGVDPSVLAKYTKPQKRPKSAPPKPDPSTVLLYTSTEGNGHLQTGADLW